VGLARRRTVAEIVFRDEQPVRRRSASRHRHRCAARSGRQSADVGRDLVRRQRSERRPRDHDPHGRGIFGDAAPTRRDERRTRRRRPRGNDSGVGRVERGCRHPRAARAPGRPPHVGRERVRRPADTSAAARIRAAAERRTRRAGSVGVRTRAGACECGERGCGHSCRSGRRRTAGDGGSGRRGSFSVCGRTKRSSAADGCAARARRRRRVGRPRVHRRAHARHSQVRRCVGGCFRARAACVARSAAHAGADVSSCRDRSEELGRTADGDVVAELGRAAPAGDARGSYSRAVGTGSARRRDRPPPPRRSRDQRRSGRDPPRSRRSSMGAPRRVLHGASRRRCGTRKAWKGGSYHGRG
jgi:hypothetical protein